MSRLDLISSTYFISSSGLETTLLFLEGIDLTHFAAFHQWNNEKGRGCIYNFWVRHLALAKKFKVNFLLETPTWRANLDWAQKLEYSAADLTKYYSDITEQLNQLRSEHETESTKIILGAVLGPRGDGYFISEKMTVEEAQAYHSLEISASANAGADLVISYTLTYPEEAIGIVKAAKAHNIPVVISFTVETDGKLGCGLEISQFVQAIDDGSEGGPLFYQINCAHLSHFRKVFEDNKDENWVRRFLGLLPNASRKSHEELNNSTVLDDGDFEEFGRDIREIKELFPHFRVFGGCCGTDLRHIESICNHCFADRLN